MALSASTDRFKRMHCRDLVLHSMHVAAGFRQESEASSLHIVNYITRVPARVRVSGGRTMAGQRQKAIVGRKMARRRASA